MEPCLTSKPFNKHSVVVSRAHVFHSHTLSVHLRCGERCASWRRPRMCARARLFPYNVPAHISSECYATHTHTQARFGRTRCHYLCVRECARCLRERAGTFRFTNKACRAEQRARVRPARIRNVVAAACVVCARARAEANSH